MPNHIITEVKIPVADGAPIEFVRSLICNSSGQVDFEVLLPIPINYWKGSVGSKHEKCFPGNALDWWCSENWGTKWNAYGERSAIYADGVLTLCFKTAWSTPRGWMCALFNTAKVSFTYRFLDEGAMQARAGHFTLTPNSFGHIEWDETESPSDTDELGAILWGEASWAEIKAEQESESQ